MPRRDLALPRLDITGWIVVLVAALLAVGGGALVRKEVSRWSDREVEIAMKQEQLGRLRALMAHADAIRDTVMFVEGRGASMPQLITARSAAAAGAEVQGLIQDLASQSDITVNSLDVAGDAETIGTLSAVPVTISAIGDIHGVAAWLDRLQYGPRVVEIRELGITPNSALRGEMLQLSMTLRAPFMDVPSAAAPPPEAR